MNALPDLARQITFEALPARAQKSLPGEPFDRWITPDGDVAAEFRRIPSGYCARFPGQADFEISLERLHVRGTPDEGTPLSTVETLFRNSIQPIIGNHLGGLHLHGSAVKTPAGAIAFLGLSRSGKTTLAGAFAHAGHPFLTEDVLTLKSLGGEYMVQPQRPTLRLFHDSASWLLGTEPDWGDSEAKNEISANGRLPYWGEPTALSAICLLGPGESETVELVRLGEAEALTQLIRHAFVLDVEDRPKLRSHFVRLGELAASTACHALDYPRSYAQLPEVIGAVIVRAKLGA